MQVLNCNSHNLRNKENRGSSPSKELIKLKIELNDRIFECHRLEEDFAQERAKLVIDFQKERGHLNKTIKELKEKNQSDNQDWTNKIDQIRQEKAEALRSLAKEYEKKMQQSNLTLKSEITAEFHKQICTLKDSLLERQNELQRKGQQWKKEKEEMIRTLSNNFGRKEQQLSKGYSAMLDGMKKDYEGRLNQVQYLYMKEEQSRKKCEKELEEKIRENAKQTVILEGINNQLTRENEALAGEIDKLKQNIHQKNTLQDAMSRNFEEEKKLAASQHLDQLCKIKSACNKQNQQIIEIHRQQVMQLKSQMNALQTIYREKENLWDQRGKKLLELYERRESKKEDVKAIEKLEVELIKRDFMLEKERSQLKHCKLELQNMEQIYDKMFLSNNYLAKIKAKSFKVKKLKAALINSNNRSMIQNRKTIFDDLK